MFSDRFGSEAPEASALWKAKEAREAAELPILDLTLSNPTQVGLVYPTEIPRLLNRERVLDYSPKPQGLEETRQAIADYYASRARSISADDLILTASTSEAYSFLFKLLCNPGDEILIPTPSYPLFDCLAELENIKLVRYPLRAQTLGKKTTWQADMALPGVSDWQADFDFLRTHISTRCKALILVNPNNPTGHICQEDEIRQYLELAQEYQLALIVDEVFCDYLLEDKKFFSVLSSGPLVFTLNGFSKLLGLPQLKLGWIHVSGDRAAQKAALGHLEWLADAFLSVNTPVQLAAKDLLELAQPIQTQILSRIHANLNRAQILIGAHPTLKYTEPEAGWSLVLEVDTPLSDDDFALTLLNQHGVLVHPGHLFGFERGCRIVISLIGPEAIFDQGICQIMTLARAVAHG